jgi:hypothetical protein
MPAATMRGLKFKSANQRLGANKVSLAANLMLRGKTRG